MAADGFRGVDHQVHEHLLDLAAVGFDGRQIVFQVEMQRDLLGDGRLDEAADFGDEGREIQRLHHEPALAGIGQHLPGQVGGLFAGFDDAIQQLGGGVVGRKQFLGEAGVADHADQQVIEVMGDAARQQPEALQLLSLPEALLGACAR